MVSSPSSCDARSVTVRPRMSCSTPETETLVRSRVPDWRMLSVPMPPMICARAGAPETSSTSSPSPASAKMVPVPTAMVSLPPPPERESAVPVPPLRLSFPAPPFRVSLPDPPVRVSLPLPVVIRSSPSPAFMPMFGKGPVPGVLKTMASRPALPVTDSSERPVTSTAAVRAGSVGVEMTSIPVVAPAAAAMVVKVSSCAILSVTAPRLAASSRRSVLETKAFVRSRAPFWTMVSVPLPPLTCAAVRPPRTPDSTKVSSLAPPKSVSAPPLPRMVSLPAPPVTLSAPRPASRLSLPLAPSSVSPAADGKEPRGVRVTPAETRTPVIVSLPAEPRKPAIVSLPPRGVDAISVSLGRTRRDGLACACRSFAPACHRPRGGPVDGAAGKRALPHEHGLGQGPGIAPHVGAPRVGAAPRRCVRDPGGVQKNAARAAPRGVPGIPATTAARGAARPPGSSYSSAASRRRAPRSGARARG